MKRLLFISNLFPDRDSPVRGLDNAVLLRHLARSAEIRVLSPRACLRSSRVRNYQSTNVDAARLQPLYVPTPYVPKFGSRWNARLMRHALRSHFENLVTDFRPDAVLTSWLFPDGCAVAPLAAEHRIPHVLITQGSDTHVYLSDRIRRRQIVAATEASSAVICRSADLGARLAAAGAEPAKLHTVYNGIDPTVFRPRDPGAARMHLSPAPDPLAKVLLFIGNFLPVKNPLFLLRAHASVCRELDSPISLYLVGAGPLEDAMRREVDQLGTRHQVHFTGPLPSGQVATHLAAADALCLTSQNEGLPNVILEALACDRPIVATDVGGISELVDRPSRGCLVPRGDLDRYTAALRQTLEKKRLPPGSDNFGETFSWEQSAERYRDLLQSAIENFPP